LRPLLEDRGRITELIRILVPVDRMKQKCFQITTQEIHQEMRYSERELSLQRGKITVFDRHEIRLRVRVSSLAIRFGRLSYDDIVQAVQSTIDSCINSATDRHGHLAYLYRTPNPYPNPGLVLGCVYRSATAALLMYICEFRSIHDGILSILTVTVT